MTIDHLIINSPYEERKDYWSYERAIIRKEWIFRAVEHPVREVIQQDGRIRRRRWSRGLPHLK
jgi:hypothetical protein